MDHLVGLDQQEPVRYLDGQLLPAPVLPATRAAAAVELRQEREGGADGRLPPLADPVDRRRQPLRSTGFSR